MKTFEKWYNETYDPHSKYLIGPANAWRAALEWIRNNEDALQGDANNETWWKIIDKELEKK